MTQIENKLKEILSIIKVQDIPEPLKHTIDLALKYLEWELNLHSDQIDLLLLVYHIDILNQFNTYQNLLIWSACDLILKGNCRGGLNILENLKLNKLFC